MIKVSIAKQTLFHHRNTGVCHAYPISTAQKGVGNLTGSLQTPLGKHEICQKIGSQAPIMTAFRGRKPVGIYQAGTDNPNNDWILTRILWLSGMQTGINKRGKVDTFSRYIYIHGTHDEENIGTPASHGCIRMLNHDIIELFEHCECHESVVISRS